MTTADATHDAPDGHDHPQHEAPSYDDVNTPVIVLVAVISAIITLLTIMFVQGMYYHWQSSFVRQRSTETVSMPATAQIAEQKSVLIGGDGIMPIEDAMQKVVTQYGR